MRCEIRKDGAIQIHQLNGRLDASGAVEYETSLKTNWSSDLLCLVIDMTHVDYLSSAGLRIFLGAYKRLKNVGGELILVNVSSYCQDVLGVTGFAETFTVCGSIDEAGHRADRIVKERRYGDDWSSIPSEKTSSGSAKIMAFDAQPATLSILGDVKDVLNARISSNHLRAERFSGHRATLGIGALGKDAAASFPMLGQMMTLGNAVMWLPADGRDTADFLSIRTDSSELAIWTPFQLSIPDVHNMVVYYESADSGGTEFVELCRDLFAIVAKRYPNYHGLVSLVGAAESPAMVGSGLKAPPIAENAPSNGKTIDHPENRGRWFVDDSRPRRQDATLLLAGCALDLMADLSDFDEMALDRVFHLSPVALGGKREVVHCHGAAFERRALPEHPVDVEKAIDDVLSNGEFLDMRRLDGKTTIARAVLGIGVIQRCVEVKSGAEKIDVAVPTPHQRRSAMNAYRKTMGSD